MQSKQIINLRALYLKNKVETLYKFQMVPFFFFYTIIPIKCSVKLQSSNVNVKNIESAFSYLNIYNTIHHYKGPEKSCNAEGL